LFIVNFVFKFTTCFFLIYYKGAVVTPFRHFRTICQSSRSRLQRPIYPFTLYSAPFVPPIVLYVPFSVVFSTRFLPCTNRHFP